VAQHRAQTRQSRNRRLLVRKRLSVNVSRRISGQGADPIASGRCPPRIRTNRICSSKLRRRSQPPLRLSRHVSPKRLSNPGTFFSPGEMTDESQDRQVSRLVQVDALAIDLGRPRRLPFCRSYIGSAVHGDHLRRDLLPPWPPVDWWQSARNVAANESRESGEPGVLFRRSSRIAPVRRPTTR